MNIDRDSSRSDAEKSSLAMTLVEVMVSLGIGSLVLAVVGMFTLTSGRNFASMGNYVELDSASRRTLDQMIREIRGTTLLTAYQTNQLTFKDYDGANLAYTYDPVAQTLTRFKAGGTNQLLLTNCVALNFGVYQRNPQSGGGFVSTVNPANCKLIDVTWKCVRTNYMSTKLNTESVQTAKIVIRNKR